MQAVILTGGRGTRLGSLTDRTPKGLVRVAGKPFLEHLLLYLRGQGVERVLLCTGYLGEKIADYFGDGGALGLRIEYSREDSPRGTGGALKLARDRLEEEFFLLNGDTYAPVDYRGLAWEFTRSGTGMTLAVHPGSRPGAPPNLRVDGKGRVTSVRLPGMAGNFTHLDAGVRAAKRKIINFFPSADSFSLEADLYPRLAAAGQLRAWEANQAFFDIGTPQRIEIFERYLTGRAGG